MKTAGEIYIETKAEEIAKAEGIPYVQAYTKAMEENPHYYELHAQEFANRDPAKALAEQSLEDERKKPKKPTKSEEQEQIERLAQKRSSDRGESFAKALTAVIEEDPSLYEEYDASRTARSK